MSRKAQEKVTNEESTKTTERIRTQLKNEHFRDAERLTIKDPLYEGANASIYIIEVTSNGSTEQFILKLVHAENVSLLKELKRDAEYGKAISRRLPRYKPNSPFDSYRNISLNLDNGIYAALVLPYLGETDIKYHIENRQNEIFAREKIVAYMKALSNVSRDLEIINDEFGYYGNDVKSANIMISMPDGDRAAEGFLIDHGSLHDPTKKKGPVRMVTSKTAPVPIINDNNTFGIGPLEGKNTVSKAYQANCMAIVTLELLFNTNPYNSNSLENRYNNRAMYNPDTLLLDIMLDDSDLSDYYVNFDNLKSGTLQLDDQSIAEVKQWIVIACSPFPFGPPEGFSDLNTHIRARLLQEGIDLTEGEIPYFQSLTDMVERMKVILLGADE